MLGHESSKRDGPTPKLIIASKIDEVSLTEEAISEEGADLARTIHSRLRQVSSRHGEILEILGKASSQR